VGFRDRESNSEMAQITTGLRSVLTLPLIYKTLQTMVGAAKFRRYFIDHYVRPRPGERILDIGCGPGEIVPYLPEGVKYVGYDISPEYIDWANRRFGGRGEFIATRFDESELVRHAPFDKAIVIAVLHHLDDDEARNLLSLLKRAVRPGGRVITADLVSIDGQNPIAQMMVDWDRGQNVRRAHEYTALARPLFEQVEGEIIDKALIPRTLRSWIMQCG
jgi:cyclopropane fatty-acyl-phospholipid synthase-like methyltransferase